MLRWAVGFYREDFTHTTHRVTELVDFELGLVRCLVENMKVLKRK